MSAVAQHLGFRVMIDEQGQPTVIYARGDLDSFSAGQLREAFVGLVGRPAVIVDISEVPFLDSAGLGALVGGVRRLRESGTTVALCCMTPRVLRLLSVTGFDRLVAVVESHAAALDVIAEEQLAIS
jgi:anti-sigma B factor antagonist